MMRGYGLYCTSRRVIGVKNRKAGAGFLLGAAVGGAIGGLVAQKMSRDEALQRIHELDEKKDFDLGKAMITRIELKKPGMIVGGHVIFVPKSGEPIKIKVGAKQDFEAIRDLMKRFYPQVLSEN
jgi:hypothetical protein